MDQVSLINRELSLLDVRYLRAWRAENQRAHVISIDLRTSVLEDVRDLYLRVISRKVERMQRVEEELEDQRNLTRILLQRTATTAGLNNIGIQLDYSSGDNQERSIDL